MSETCTGIGALHEKFRNGGQGGDDTVKWWGGSHAKGKKDLNIMGAETQSGGLP